MAGRIRYIGVRQEEVAAFMASGFAKHTGRLGVCVGTIGPGDIHLLNGLYDANFNGALVVAVTGTTFHGLGGTRYQQGVDPIRLMQDVALYNVEVTGPEHAVVVAERACRAAMGDRGVAPHDRQGHLDDEAFGRQAVGGQPRRGCPHSAPDRA